VHRRRRNAIAHGRGRLQGGELSCGGLEGVEGGDEGVELGSDGLGGGEGGGEGGVLGYGGL
jgi:hypothetical protein